MKQDGPDAGDRSDQTAHLPPDKRQRILDAAIREFAENGYQKASTNRIVKEAGIAKGLLFHYFGNKTGLFVVTLDYAADFYIDYFLRTVSDLPADLLDRLMTWLTLKMKMLSEYPLMYRMSVEAAQDVPAEVRAAVAKTYARATERLMPVFMKGMDFSGLREGIDPQKAIRFIMLALNGIAEKFIEEWRERPDKGLADLPAALKEIDEYKEMLRYGLYKQG